MTRSAPAFDTPAGLARTTFGSMGTDVVVLAPRGAVAAVEEVRALFAEWDLRFSRFRLDSELSRVNAAAGRPVVVSEAFAAVLTTVLRAARATDGLFDPTLLAPLMGLGYDRTFMDLPADREAVDADAADAASRTGSGGWRAIGVAAQARLVELPAGVGLDFGGIAKGMAVDAALTVLRGRGIEAAAVSAGGDLAVVGSPPGASGWPIALETAGHPVVVELEFGALATSSVLARRWRVGGTWRHHLLDPRTGLPANSGLASVSVAAATCAQAEVAAKAALILGPGRGAAFLVDRALDGLLAFPDGSTARVAGRAARPARAS